jgi:imidazolonepropionase-like amidohydrolase
VIVRDGRIASITAASAARIPSDARRIDGAGKFLIPGLTDMHTHLYSDGDVPDAAGPAELGVILANGVTTIRLMMGTPEQLALRSQVMSGAVVGPQMWLASPQFMNRASENARVITSPTDARGAVHEMIAAGYDYIKVTFGITGAVYEALVDESKRAGIRIVGHVEPAVGVRRAIADGQQIEHLDAYFEAALADSASMRVSLTQGGVYRNANWASIDFIDDAKLTELAQLTAKSGIWTGPTLTVFNESFGVPVSDAELKARPDWDLVPRPMRPMFMTNRARLAAMPVSPEKRARYAEIRNTLVKRISDAGGRIFTGSDSPDLLYAYGFTLHREMQSLVHAGLTPYQALVAATRNPAEWIGSLSEFGTIETGKRADMVLLDANPLADISNTQRIAGVMVGGRWMEKAELAAMVAAGVKAIDGAADR